MKKRHRLPPKITEFYNEEDRALYESIERGEWKPLPKKEFEAMRKRLEEAARYTMRKDKSISIRLSADDFLFSITPSIRKS